MDHIFYLQGGGTLQSVDDLRRALSEMSDKVFHYHVNDNKNDFSQWLKDVHNEGLADAIADAKSRRTMIRALEHYQSKKRGGKMAKKKLSRKDFLKKTAVGAGAIGALAGMKWYGSNTQGLSSVTGAVHAGDALNTNTQIGQKCSATRLAAQFGLNTYDDHTYETLNHIGEQMVPSTDASGNTEPGFVEACAVNLLELSAAQDPELFQLLGLAVAAIDQSSSNLYGNEFKGLTFSQQKDVLEKVATGTAPGTLWNAAIFGMVNLPQALGTVAKAAGGGFSGGKAVAGAVQAAKRKNFQPLIFSTLRFLCTAMWISNFPEIFSRDTSQPPVGFDPNTGQPIFQPIVTDTQNLISQLNQPGSGSAFDVISYNPYPSFDNEKLLWQWQAGVEVDDVEDTFKATQHVGILKERNSTEDTATADASGLNVVSTADRKAARDQLYQLSAQGDL